MRKVFVSVMRGLASVCGINSDNLAHRFPVSVKAVIEMDGRVVLLKNDREEWELPGGKLEPNEAPAECVVREVQEELGIDVAISRLLDVWVYEITQDVRVLIVTYACLPLAATRIVLSHEHKAVGVFRHEEVGILRMPDGYKSSINAYFADSARAKDT